ncbi:conserved protein of unknown function [Pseudodesulfovibrio profundus]|uniref:Uncharacterized protein n=1 Tax=Pseudodesulfovibrio profundus TaxID=57320 RepID=A0A2C8F3W0_9BACT|nr:hypothetical protein [Pseudodesulfovibrio profundus]SOB57052.1 conserved protein of unknown function [Pseudodesulfovibrio profundus]
MKNIDCLSLKMKSESRAAWNYILQKGFWIVGPAGNSVRDFVKKTLGYDDDILDEQVRTIFLNNSPVDSIDGVYVEEGAKLALGGAMPGLVGIVMGRDNPYKEFRSGISCKETEGAGGSSQQVRVFLKIFSTLAVATGTDILTKGLELKAETLRDFLEKQKVHLLNPEVLTSLDSTDDAPIRFTVEFKN